VETFRTLTGDIEPSKTVKNNPAFSDIIGQSKPIKRLFKILPDIAASEANVFLTGESGTGKELFARAIHNNSSRAKHPFVAVNCAALAETLLESELFGHEKSAFTGATKTKPGRFELVKKGTLFLDEIGELKPSLQIKLLRVLEQREFERVGGTMPIPLEARIISATNRDISLALEDGSFRKDFYYRLRTVPMIIPPLRERKEDIPLLVNFFTRVFNATFKKKVREVDKTVMDFFLDYHWPGNVRELERTIEHAFVFVKGPVILFDNLPQLDVFVQKAFPETLSNNKIDLSKDEIIQALKEADG
jgi:transcriptional regulator with PAS, ATPase and Fis domain